MCAVGGLVWLGGGCGLSVGIFLDAGVSKILKQHTGLCGRLSSLAKDRRMVLVGARNMQPLEQTATFRPLPYAFFFLLATPNMLPGRATAKSSDVRGRIFCTAYSDPWLTTRTCRGFFSTHPSV